MSVNSAESAMNQLKTDDAAVQNALSYLQEHTSFMSSMSSTVDTLRSDLANCYQAQSSATFQSKVNEWIDSYMGLKAAVQQLQDDLSTAHQTIGRAEEEITQNAGSWNTTDGSDPVFQALHG
ncbi:hypothetical protein ACFV2H_37635 [Streptomyces sp. NPDC059629]|uniref:hypothetical protein n=1 Tax=Streptomyces sp. NPDC059629 TaxID=3346889 RepID=UPI0036937B1B